jgi:DNA-binding MarR family transcriptional regulator
LTNDRDVQAQSGEERVKILLRRYKLLKELFIAKECTLTELSERLGVDLGNLSKAISDLEKKELITVREVERTGRPLRYLSLSMSIAPIVSDLMDLEKPVSNYEPQVIDLCLDVVEDNLLDQKIRKLYVNTLSKSFTSMPEKIVPTHERMKRFLEDFMENHQTSDEIDQLKRSMVENSIPRLMGSESSRSWVTSFLYPNALKILENKTKPEDVVVWSVSVLGKIGTCSDKKLYDEIEDKLIKAYFNDAVEPESKAAGRLLDSILGMMHGKPPSSQFVGQLRTYAKSDNEKEKKKAVQFLERIVEQLTISHIKFDTLFGL